MADSGDEAVDQCRATRMPWTGPKAKEQAVLFEPGTWDAGTFASPGLITGAAAGALKSWRAAAHTLKTLRAAVSIGDRTSWLGVSGDGGRQLRNRFCVVHFSSRRTSILSEMLQL